MGIAYCGVEPRVVSYGAHITHPWWGQSSVWRTQIHPQSYGLDESYDSFDGEQEREYPTIPPAEHEYPTVSPAEHDYPTVSPAEHEYPTVPPADHEGSNYEGDVVDAVHDYFGHHDY